MEFNDWILKKFPVYSKVYGKINVPPEEKELASREILRFTYPFISLNSDSYAPLLRIDLDGALLLGFVGWPVLPNKDGLTVRERIKQKCKEKLEIDYEDGKHIAVHFYRGVEGPAEYAVFQLPIV